MITATGEYALRAAVFLAQNTGHAQTSTLIAEGTKVPQGYLSKILQQMVRANVITSQRGIHGGFVLARPAREISVLDVLRAVDAGPGRIERCPLGIADHVRLCPVHKLVDEALANVEKAFRTSDLESLSKSSRGITALCKMAE
jgi:Rrf2 family protein